MRLGGLSVPNPGHVKRLGAVSLDVGVKHADGWR